MYKIQGEKDKYLSLPVMRHEKKLPVVLSREEVRRLIATPQRTKHQLLLMLLYGCGLRCAEIRGIRMTDMDFDRRVLHVKNGKGRSQRYVPISQIVIDKTKEYIAVENPKDWLFQTQTPVKKPVRKPYSRRGVYWVVKAACEKAVIMKNVSPHTLRHTFATHLLEDGLDIISIKELLGHSRIETTMVYLHVAQCDRMRAYSPLDTLYGLRKPNFTVASHEAAREFHNVCPFR